MTLGLFKLHCQELCLIIIFFTFQVIILKNFLCKHFKPNLSTKAKKYLFDKNSCPYKSFVAPLLPLPMTPSVTTSSLLSSLSLLPLHSNYLTKYAQLSSFTFPTDLENFSLPTTFFVHSGRFRNYKKGLEKLLELLYRRSMLQCKLSQSSWVTQLRGRA